MARSHHSVKRIATSGPPLPLQARRYPLWHQINSPTERRLAVVQLHSEGWSITSIAAYLQVNRKTVYATLQRWAEEEFAGLPDKSKARKGPHKVTLKVRNEIRKLQENPLLGEYRARRRRAVLSTVAVQLYDMLSIRLDLAQLDKGELIAGPV